MIMNTSMSTTMSAAVAIIMNISTTTSAAVVTITSMRTITSAVVVIIMIMKNTITKIMAMNTAMTTKRMSLRCCCWVQPCC